jgi:hypothetical protein
MLDQVGEVIVSQAKGLEHRALIWGSHLRALIARKWRRLGG